eukprot:TRINITY_DN49719_c0_g1_i2.p1 TRINITY_DN49719_c0_g1~~TRINITY_DN49719_c0_g1_i2.p1  ORF type:complete len:389 (+),score=62.01 TRINITY_DN49719_c0_g1_i2:124-1167(+)
MCIRDRCKAEQKSGNAVYTCDNEECYFIRQRFSCPECFHNTVPKVFQEVVSREDPYNASLMTLAATKEAIHGESVVVLEHNCESGTHCCLVRTDTGQEGFVPEMNLVPCVPDAPSATPILSNPVVWWFLLGTLQTDCPITLMRNQSHLLEIIFEDVYAHWFYELSWKEQSVFKVGEVTFPAPRGISINMMPIIVGDLRSLPDYCQQYQPLIKQCSPTDAQGTVGYLSIEEGTVQAGHSQRRPGLHTDKSTMCSSSGTKGTNDYWTHGWGMGSVKKGEFSGGIFMASNVSDSTEVWDGQVAEPGLLGDVEFLRDQLGAGILLKKNELFWITDQVGGAVASAELLVDPT